PGAHQNRSSNASPSSTPGSQASPAAHGRSDAGGKKRWEKRCGAGSGAARYGKPYSSGSGITPYGPYGVPPRTEPKPNAGTHVARRSTRSRRPYGPYAHGPAWYGSRIRAMQTSSSKPYGRPNEPNGPAHGSRHS